jgi:hypothetical protein
MHPWRTTWLSLASIILFSPVPPEARAADEPVVLKSAEMKSVGDEKNLIFGFSTTGPVFPSGTAVFHVDIGKAQVDELKIARLYFSKRDTVPTIPGHAKVRDVNLWVPQKFGSFSRTVPERKGSPAPILTIKALKALPDGVYCIHTGDLAKAKEAPAFATQFTVGGIAEISIAEKGATFENGKARLTLMLKNAGTGEFNNAFLVITLQRTNPEKGKSAFTNRWNVGLPTIPAGATVKYEKEFPTAGWLPESYYFYGHPNWVGSGGDTDCIEIFKTAPFVVPKPTE